jgi:ribosomal protein S18 acetylase RimI-like enzyme
MQQAKRNADIHLRAARASDARSIAELIAISSDGVALIEWQQQASGNPAMAPLDIGAAMYARDEGNYSFRNCTIAEVDGQIGGMLLTFAVPEGPVPRLTRKRPGADDPDVFAPVKYLEEPNSWYVCGVALFPEHRGRGIGTELMATAEAQARERGFDTLSLVAFAENRGAVRLYQRLGYRIVDHAPIVPHPMIPYTGDALLMTRDVMQAATPRE